MNLTTIKKLNVNIPSFRQRTEKETEEMLHKYRVLARKKQIQLVKLDSEYPFQPWSMSTYTNPERRIHLLKVIWEYLKYGVKQLMP